MNKIMQKIRVGEPLSENELKALGFKVKEETRGFVTFFIRNGVSFTVIKDLAGETKVNIITFEKNEFEKKKNEILKNDILEFLLRKVNAPQKILNTAKKSNSITIEDLEKIGFTINQSWFGEGYVLKKGRIWATFIADQNKLELTSLEVSFVNNDAQTLMFACKRAGAWKEAQY